jgi:hypothetical protein
LESLLTTYKSIFKHPHEIVKAFVASTFPLQIWDNSAKQPVADQFAVPQRKANVGQFEDFSGLEDYGCDCFDKFGITFDPPRGWAECTTTFLEEPDEFIMTCDSYKNVFAYDPVSMQAKWDAYGCWDTGDSAYAEADCEALRNVVSYMEEKGYTDFEDVFRNLFDAQLTAESNYENYYAECAPSSCTWTEVRRRSPAEVITVILGLYGGLDTGLKAFLGYLAARAASKLSTSSSTGTKPQATKGDVEMS